MLTRLVFLSALLVGLASSAGPATAITDGDLDGNEHPYVGLMRAYDADGKRLWRCSGTLLSARLFLTAGHCTEAPVARVEIWFGADLTGVSPDARPGDAGGTPYTHPAYDPNRFYVRDLGMVVLDRPHPMATYGALPAADQLDSLQTRRGKQDVTFTAVGYGLQKSFPDAASWKTSAQRIRMVAYPKLDQINTGLTGDFSLLLSNNAHTGGTCFGDSGGPNFVGRSNVIAGVTSYGLNGSCAGTGGVYRLDRSWNLNWIGTFGL